MGTKASLLAALLTTTALNAAAADPPPGPDFVVEEHARGGEMRIASVRHYRPVAGAPVTVPLEGWSCAAYAPSAEHSTAVWSCRPTDSLERGFAMVECNRGDFVTMTVVTGDGTTTKMYRVYVDWRGGH